MYFEYFFYSTLLVIFYSPFLILFGQVNSKAELYHVRAGMDMTWCDNKISKIVKNWLKYISNYISDYQNI